MADYPSPYDLNALAESRRRFRERRSYEPSRPFAALTAPEDRKPGWRAFFLSASAAERYEKQNDD